VVDLTIEKDLSLIMKNLTLVARMALAGVALAFVGSAVLLAEGSPKDDALIRQRLATYAEARNRGDAHAEALCYTEDGDFRSSRPTSRGRAEIERTLTVSVATYEFSLKVDTVRFLDSKIAIADAEIGAGPAQRKVSMTGTYVMVKEKGMWLITAARITTAQQLR
jgi:uncharacterized protein (TIGR02246 family)